MEIVSFLILPFFLASLISPAIMPSLACMWLKRG